MADYYNNEWHALVLLGDDDDVRHAGDYERALRYCFLVVGYLRVVLCAVPRHPLLGLQLYTLGDILTTRQGRAAEALHVYTWSHKVGMHARTVDVVSCLSLLLFEMFFIVSCCCTPHTCRF
jgi:hypothetical protein